MKSPRSGSEKPGTLRRREAAQTPTLSTHWRVFEGVVAAIERSVTDIPGARVIPNAKVPESDSDRTRQVDVVVEIPTGSRCLRIGVEVRDTANALDVTKIEQLGAKLRTLQIDRCCIVARSGFTADACVKAMRLGLELRTLPEIEAPGWWLADHFTVVSRTVELLAWRLDYAPEDIERVRNAVMSIPGDAALLITPSDAPTNFRAFIANQGRLFVEKGNPAAFPDGSEFSLNVELALPDASFLEFGSTRLPLPAAVFCHFRVHNVLERVPVAAYWVDEKTNAFTGVWTALGKQLTMVTKELPNGARTYTVSVADASPSPTTLPAVNFPPSDIPPTPGGPARKAKPRKKRSHPI